MPLRLLRGESGRLASHKLEAQLLHIQNYLPSVRVGAGSGSRSSWSVRAVGPPPHGRAPTHQRPVPSGVPARCSARLTCSWNRSGSSMFPTVVAPTWELGSIDVHGVLPRSRSRCSVLVRCAHKPDQKRSRCCLFGVCVRAVRTVQGARVVGFGVMRVGGER